MKPTNQDSDGTSFYGVKVDASLRSLTQILGEPTYQNNTSEDKTNVEWVMETEDGDVFTVYDWKEGRPIDEDEIITWHIGSKNKLIGIQAKIEIMGYND
jgi:hypothetical protein